MNDAANISAWERVGLARMAERPTAKIYIDLLFEDFFEMHGDRNFRDDPSMLCGIASFKGIPITVIAEEKGINTKDKVYRNFGSPFPEGYRKALRLMKQAEKFNRPIVCFVDTQGAYCGIGAEERGQGEAIARNLFEMMRLKTPVISIVIGEGGSGGALAVAVADRVYMLENAIYSILSPEGFASILWKDSTRAEEAAGVMRITAGDLLDLGIIDGILKEADGGAHTDPEKTAEQIEKMLQEELPKLCGEDIETLCHNRYEKFRKMGSQVLE